MKEIIEVLFCVAALLFIIVMILGVIVLAGSAIVELIDDIRDRILFMKYPKDKLKRK